MLRLTTKQNSFRTILIKIEKKVRVLQVIRYKINTIPVLEKINKLLYKLDKKQKKIGKVRNICFLSGRMRGTYRYFKMSRIFIRELGNAGFFIGMRKTSF